MANADSIRRGAQSPTHHAMTARERARIYEVSPTTRTAHRRLFTARDERTINSALNILERGLTKREVLLSAAAVKSYLRLQLAGQHREQFGALYLDAQNRLIAFEVAFVGTLTQVSVHPREIVLRAVTHHAASIVLSHNHPSGALTPSAADVAVTNTLKTALALVDVRVLDHVIVARDGALSMAELGLL